IAGERRAYCDALAHATDTFAQSGVADLGPMEAYLERLLRTQLEVVGLATIVDAERQTDAAG
ncbi:MAG TPA: hypothetical protein VKT30_13800, partial [Caulobacteraceae bacterium]|nr:hypothetical protein [Caulobacteraceae bacterium]